ncbi:MAG TPA: hypothetical protein VFC72_04155 [Corynebacterium sp.]|nr:hypothetical protein [Corynebacterium sp.]
MRSAITTDLLLSTETMALLPKNVRDQGLGAASDPWGPQCGAHHRRRDAAPPTPA